MTSVTKSQLQEMNADLAEEVEQLTAERDSLVLEMSQRQANHEEHVRTLTGMLEAAQTERDHLLAVNSSMAQDASSRNLERERLTQRISEMQSHWERDVAHHERQREQLAEEQSKLFKVAIAERDEWRSQARALRQELAEREDEQTRRDRELAERGRALELVRATYGPTPPQDAMKLADYMVTGMIAP